MINHYMTAYSDMGSYYYQTRHHTDTFSNSTFDGQDYTFSIIVNQIGILWSHMEHNGTMETYVDYYGRDRIEDAFRLPPRVMIELQAITPDYYKYLKSVELYNDSESEKESAVGIYHNVQNGWGIFGAMSYDRHFVEYGE